MVGGSKRVWRSHCIHDAATGQRVSVSTHQVRTRYVDIAVLGFAAVLGYAAVAQGVQLVLELPECVALEIKAWGVLEQPCQDMLSSHAPTSHFFRHGKRFMRHSYHARRIGPGPGGIVRLGATVCFVGGATMARATRRT
jgi:hypothetical protein